MGVVSLTRGITVLYIVLSARKTGDDVGYRRTKRRPLDMSIIECDIHSTLFSVSRRA